jgi:hypothetical protein
LKSAFAAALIAATLATAGTAGAQVFGQFTGADVLPVNGRLFGAYAHNSENVVGLLSQLRLSFYPGMDFGFQGGVARQDFSTGDRTTVRLSADLKVAVKTPNESLPIAIAVGANIGVESGDDFGLLTLGPTVAASRNFTVGESGSIAPYAGVGLSFKRIDVGTLDDTDVSFPLRAGSEFRVAPHLKLVLELQFNIEDSFNDDLGIALGANLPF